MKAPLCPDETFRGYGGALALRGFSQRSKVSILNCTFSDNRAATGIFRSTSGGQSADTGPVGGALYKDVSFGSLEVMNCLFVGNIVDARAMPCCLGAVSYTNANWPAGGGALAFGSSMSCPLLSALPTQSTIWNSTIFGNEVRSEEGNTRFGRGIWSDTSSGYLPPETESPSLAHALLGPSLVVVNSIVYGNNGYAVGSSNPDETTGDQIGFPDGESCNPPYVAYTNVEGGWSFWGTGTVNISANPMFVDAENRNFRLLCGSPCIDAGTLAGIPLDIYDIAKSGGAPTLPVPDLDLRSRVMSCGEMVDMGAYEWNSHADLNCDCCVNLTDLLALLAA
jgi:hypothetical protein